MAQMDDFLARCALNFSDHKLLLEAMQDAQKRAA
jgi:hypothetical protein